MRYVALRWWIGRDDEMEMGSRLAGAHCARTASRFRIYSMRYKWRIKCDISRRINAHWCNIVVFGTCNPHGDGTSVETLPILNGFYRRGQGDTSARNWADVHIMCNCVTILECVLDSNAAVWFNRWINAIGRDAMGCNTRCQTIRLSNAVLFQTQCTSFRLNLAGSICCCLVMAGKTWYWIGSRNVYDKEVLSPKYKFC